MASDTLTITDNRTGKAYEVPITDDTIRAIDLRQIKVKDDDFGMMTYDPAFMNTAACRSAITFIDGDHGILRYRGYPIEQIAEQASLPRGGVPAERRRTPQPRPARQVDRGHPLPHLRPHQHHQVPRGLPVRRPSDGDAARHRRRPVDVLSRRQEHRTTRRTATSSGSGCWPSCRRWRRSSSGIRAGCPTSSPGTTSTTSATSST